MENKINKILNYQGCTKKEKDNFLKRYRQCVSKNNTDSDDFRIFSELCPYFISVISNHFGVIYSRIRRMIIDNNGIPINLVNQAISNNNLVS